MRRRLRFVLFTLSALAALAGAIAIGTSNDAPPRVSTTGPLVPSTASGAERVTAPAIVGAPSRETTAVVSATASPVLAPDPVAVAIPRLQVAAPVVPVGVEPGTNIVEVPDIAHVGWYRFGARPGETGAAVLVGHVDGEGRPGVFWRLRELTAGDLVVVTGGDMVPRQFRVTGREEVAKTALSPDLFSRAGPPRLVLITCGGAFNAATHHYVDNVVVVASPAQ